METKLFNFCQANANEIDRNEYFGGTCISRGDPGVSWDRNEDM